MLPIPGLSFTGGAGGAATNGDFAGKSASTTNNTFGGGSGSHGLVLNLGKNTGLNAAAAGILGLSSNTVMYAALGLGAVALLLALRK